MTGDADDYIDEHDQLLIERGLVAILRADIERLRAQLAKAQDAAWEEALTPSAETKAAYIGEFTFEIEDATFDGNYAPRQIPVPWTTIKEIMAAIKARSLKPKAQS